MAKKTCFYCGTEYEAAEGKCPICGESRTTEDEQKKKENTPVFTPDVEEEEPKGRGSSGIVSTIICIVLAIAVVIGTLFILRALGVFGSRPAADPNAELPETTQTETAAVPCTGLVVSPLNMSFTEAGQKTILTILPEPVDCTEPIELVSSDPSVVAVTTTGEVIAVGEGSANVTVTCGAQIKTANVVCAFLSSGETETEQPDEKTPVHVDASKLKLNREDFTLLKQGETFTMKLTGAPEGVDVIWSSDDPKVATIDKDGTVTGIGYGRTDIHATVGDAVVDCIVRCSFRTAAPASTTTTTTPKPNTTTTPADPIEHTAVTTPGGTVQTSTIAISHSDVTVKADETFKIFLYSGSTRLSGVSWATTNASVATVTADGTVKGVGKGTATVVGTLEGNTYRCIVRCKG